MKIFIMPLFKIVLILARLEGALYFFIIHQRGDLRKEGKLLQNCDPKMTIFFRSFRESNRASWRKNDCICRFWWWLVVICSYKKMFSANFQKKACTKTISPTSVWNCRTSVCWPTSRGNSQNMNAHRTVSTGEFSQNTMQ